MHTIAQLPKDINAGAPAPADQPGAVFPCLTKEEREAGYIIVNGERRQGVEIPLLENLGFKPGKKPDPAADEPEETASAKKKPESGKRRAARKAERDEAKESPPEPRASEPGE